MTTASSYRKDKFSFWTGNKGVKFSYSVANSSRHSCDPKTVPKKWLVIHYSLAGIRLLFYTPVTYLIIRFPKLWLVIYQNLLENSLPYQTFLNYWSLFTIKVSHQFSDIAVILVPCKVLNFSVIVLHGKFEPKKLSFLGIS